MARKIEPKASDAYLTKITKLHKHGWQMTGTRFKGEDGKSYHEFVRVNKTGGYENFKYYKVGLHVLTGKLITLS